ncbi:hypothetical protein MRX96_000286 [Rhipicephalus microplus]
MQGTSTQEATHVAPVLSVPDAAQLAQAQEHAYEFLEVQLRVPIGCPAAEPAAKKAKNRPHSLSHNIEKNVPGARLH